MNSFCHFVQIILAKSLHNEVHTSHKSVMYFSRVLLLRQIWIVNYYVKCSSDNLSNETLGFPEKLYLRNSSIWHLIHILKTFILDCWEKNTNWKSTNILQNNWCFIIWRSRRIRLMTSYLWEYPCNHPQSATTPRILTLREKHDRSILWSNYDIAWSSHFIR